MPKEDALFLRLQMVLLQIIAQACDSIKHQVSVDCMRSKRVVKFVASSANNQAVIA